MNKVTTVNLNGNAFQLEESGYEALQNYLNSASARLAGNPDKDEIIADIEQAIGEKFRALLGTYKNVVSAKEVDTVINEMGPVQDGSTESAGAASAQSDGGGAASAKSEAGAAGDKTPGQKRVHRLYRLNEGAMFAGVCSGLAAFTDMPVIMFRYLFIALTVLSFGLGALIYVAMVFIVPEADSPSERAEAQGPTPTAQDFIRRAREGYYEAMKGFPDRRSRREWKRKFKQDMRDWKQNFRWEMRANSAQWQENWGRYWSRTPLAGAAGWPIAFISGVASLILFLVCVCGVILLIATGTVFGFALPHGMPVWVAVLLMLVFFQMLSWPLQAMRYATCGWGYRRCHGGSGGFVFLIILGLAAWWIYPEQTKSVIREIPPTVHHAVDTVRDWWQEK